jgi:hypothetical protein
MTRCYMELPFLHEVSLQNHAILAASPSQPTALSAEVLLAFNALTASILVSESDSHAVTPDEYVDAAFRQIDFASSAPSLETIQVLLMVGYYQWIIQHNDCGIGSIKLAIERARVLGYHRDQNEIVDHKNDRNGFSDGFTASETRRRTFWACFIMDSYICWMAYRPRSLWTHEFQLQLPCTERAFLYGRTVKTRLIQEDDETYQKRIGDTHESNFEVEEGAVSLFIRLVYLYGEILNFSIRCI